LALPPLVRALGLAGPGGRTTEEEEARRIILETALTYLNKIRGEENQDFAELYDDLEEHYRDRLATLNGDSSDIHSDHHRRLVEVSRKLLQVERQTAVRLRNEGRINDELLRELERELDLSEARFLASSV
jgi:CPA1 family monovalent cation:H+ antiporter